MYPKANEKKHKSLRQMRKKDAHLEGRTSVMIVVQAVFLVVLLWSRRKDRLREVELIMHCEAATGKQNTVERNKRNAEMIACLPDALYACMFRTIDFVDLMWCPEARLVM
jgi:hypothetical protein